MRRATCEACGYKGGTLALTRSAVMDGITERSGLVLLDPALLACAGPGPAEDGPTACLRRMFRRNS